MAKYVYRVDKRPLTIEEKKAFAQFGNEQHDEEIGQLDIDEFAKLELYDETVTFECCYCHEKIVVDFDVPLYLINMLPNKNNEERNTY